jgi:hypothetical protein
MIAPTASRPWDPDRRANVLMARRDEFVQRLPHVTRNAAELSADVREQIVDDAAGNGRRFGCLRRCRPTSRHAA